MNTQLSHREIHIRRRGAVMPMFAFLTPIFLLVCGLAINVTYLRLARTELKIASDATAHAAGRAMSLYQNTDDAIEVAKEIGPLNSVLGQPFNIDDDWVQFGYSQRDNSGFGRYQFQSRSKSSIDSGTAQANSVSIQGNLNIDVLVRAFPQFANVPVATNSISTQVDRDIALVLDRSGSMLWFKDQDQWIDVFRDLYYRGKISYSDYYYAYYGYSNADHSNFSYYIRNNTWNRLYNDRNRNNDYKEIYEFCYDLKNVSNRAPTHSRWYYLELGVNAFFDVLDTTDQEEYVSMATFSSNASLDHQLTLSYSPIRNSVSNVYPSGSTAIGKGIQEAIPSVMSDPLARPFAAKTIVVLTDGINNVNPEPESVVAQMLQQYNITVHTVTFTNGADQDAMEDVADAGGGRHYHANDGEDLVPIFEEIANNLPTILTE
ncbi:MAG: VWA domain-containing protein [Pirellulaceae bacterium]